EEGCRQAIRRKRHQPDGCLEEELGGRTSGGTCLDHEGCGAQNGSALERFSFQTVERTDSKSQLTRWSRANGKLHRNVPGTIALFQQQSQPTGLFDAFGGRQTSRTGTGPLLFFRE